MGAWIVGSYWLPEIALMVLIGVSIMEFADIIGSKIKKTHPHLEVIAIISSLIILFSVIFINLFAFGILTISKMLAAVSGAIVLEAGFYTHNHIKIRNPVLSKKIPTALLFATFGAPIVIQLFLLLN
jgi:hypothetical protein